MALTFNLLSYQYVTFRGSNDTNPVEALRLLTYCPQNG